VSGEVELDHLNEVLGLFYESIVVPMVYSSAKMFDEHLLIIVSEISDNLFPNGILFDSFFIFFFDFRNEELGLHFLDGEGSSWLRQLLKVLSFGRSLSKYGIEGLLKFFILINFIVETNMVVRGLGRSCEDFLGLIKVDKHGGVRLLMVRPAFFGGCEICWQVK